MSLFECFEVTQKGSVVKVTMNRPDKFNTMTEAYWAELSKVFRYAEGLDDARVIILDSEGKHFSAGMDLSVFAKSEPGESTKDFSRNAERTYRSATLLAAEISTLEKIRIPVLAAVQGGCIGGAVDLATSADLRYCTKDAFFVIQETNIGIVADIGTLQRLPKLIPLAAAKEMAYTGRRVYGEEAKELGLVTRVYESKEDLDAGVLEVAEQIAAKSPLVTFGIKTTLNYSRDHSVDDGLQMVATFNGGMLSSEDLKNSMKTGGKTLPEYEKLLPTASKFESVS